MYIRVIYRDIYAYQTISYEYMYQYDTYIYIISYGYIIRDISLLLHVRVFGTVNHNMVLHNIDILHLYCNAAYKASAKFSAFGAI